MKATKACQGKDYYEVIRANNFQTFNEHPIYQQTYIYINALGNLGLQESSYALLQVIEGKLTIHPHPRSVAVYKLIRFARTNPAACHPLNHSKHS